jgi:hypothetical protein
VPVSAPEAEEAVRSAFLAQAQWCADLDSPFTAALCTAIGRNIDDGSEVGRRVLGWEGQPGGWADGLPLRLCGGLHALVRRGDAPALALCYPPNSAPDEATLWKAVRTVLESSGEALLPWLDRTPQTNEVGRSTALMSGLLAIGARFPKPMQLFELGASAGLNLVLDRYGYDLRGVSAGDPHSPLRLRPDWTGAAPPTAAVEIVERRGVDLYPVHAVGDRERLLAYVWPDQERRLAQLEAALALAAPDPPPIDAGDAADWLEARLSVEPVAGWTRIVMHSIAYQYFPRRVQERIASRLAEAGAQAFSEAPVAWLRFEKEPEDHETSLRLTLWPTGEDRLLAFCHPHGRAIRWLEG